MVFHSSESRSSSRVRNTSGAIPGAVQTGAGVSPSHTSRVDLVRVTATYSSASS